MAEKITVPTLGESVTEATVSKWLKSQGEKVIADEPIVELETDKVNVEVPAPISGTLGNIAVKEGETVNVGSLLGTINGAAETPQEVKEIKKYNPPKQTKIAEPEFKKVTEVIKKPPTQKTLDRNLERVLLALFTSIFSLNNDIISLLLSLVGVPPIRSVPTIIESFLFNLIVPSGPLTTVSPPGPIIPSFIAPNAPPPTAPIKAP